MHLYTKTGLWDTHLKNMSGTPIYKNMCLGHQFTKTCVWDTNLQKSMSLGHP